MTASQLPQHFVVDGSNIATEGRSLPSLAQLNDAVLAFMKQYPDRIITVVVDATFGHRIDKSEAAAFDEAVANNELVSPPAGAVGRGDAFVLSIADQADAGVLSNDSFQEFHGQYDWLFDIGRLIGGKPVPNVGWVFVERTPVRGPKSRESVKKSKGRAARPSDLRSEKRKAASRIRRKDDDSSPDASESQAVSQPESQPESRSETGQRDGSGRRRSGHKRATVASSNYVNDLLPFLEFVGDRRVGDEFVATVDRYASHGAYLHVDDVALYLPLNYISDPPPSSARSALTLGDEVAVVLVGYQPDRRSIDVALPAVAAAAIADRADGASNDEADTRATGRGAKTPAKKTAAKEPPARQATGKNAEDSEVTAKKSAAKKTPAQKTATSGATPNKSAAKKTPAKRSVAKKTPAKQTVANKTPAKKTPAKKSVANKTPAKKTPAKKSLANKTPAKKTPAKKTAAKKTPAKKTAANKTPAKKTAANKTPAKKTAAKKARREVGT